MFEKQIEAGMVYLDSKYPGWVDRIDLKKLSLRSGCNCMIGQLEGDFCKNNDMLVNKGKPNQTGSPLSIDLGFCVEHKDYKVREAIYEILTIEWTKAVLARRAENVESKPEVELQNV